LEREKFWPNKWKKTKKAERLKKRLKNGGNKSEKNSK